MLDPSFLLSPAYSLVNTLTQSSIECFLFGSPLALNFEWHDAEHLLQWIAGADISTSQPTTNNWMLA